MGAPNKQPTTQGGMKAPNQHPHHEGGMPSKSGRAAMGQAAVAPHGTPKPVGANKKNPLK
jgi:hypothetical protein